MFKGQQAPRPQSNPQNPNPAGSSNANQTAQGSYQSVTTNSNADLNLSLMFASQIDAAALLVNKLTFAIRNNTTRIASKNACIASQSWPPHILGSIKNLTGETLLSTAAQILRTEIAKLTENSISNQKEIDKIHPQLRKFIQDVLSIYLAQEQVNFVYTSQLNNIANTFNIRLFHHAARFLAEQEKQDMIKTKQAAIKINHDMEQDAIQLNTKSVLSLVRAELKKKPQASASSSRSPPKVQSKTPPKQDPTAKHDSKGKGKQKDFQ
jgi:hypothetical protein